MSRVTTYDVVDMKEVYQSECEHKNTTYQPREYDTNVAESYSCDECGLELWPKITTRGRQCPHQ